MNESVPLTVNRTGQDETETNAVHRVICVDLNGCLIASDLLYESLMCLLRTRTRDAVRIPVWLLKGRAHLERQLAERAAPNFATLPYRSDVVAYLRKLRDGSCRLVLATAADELLARPVAEHLGLFDDIIASDGKSSLKGRAKLLAIEARYGDCGFDYVGNSSEDLPIWESAREAVIVRPGKKLLKALHARQPPAHVFVRTEGGPATWLRMLRVHQWAKNLLVFVPLLAAHRLTALPLVLASLIAFAAFSLGASAVYVVNDLIDLTSDRVHARKRSRPLASGRIPIPVGMATLPLLVCAAIALGALLPLPFLGVLLVYLATSMAYTFILKRKLLVDVLCLAGLYTLRILGGGAAIGVEITPWLMAFSMFLFLSLAFVKRFAELAEPSRETIGYLPGRGYRQADLDMIRSVGPASGYIATLVLCLYVNDPSCASQYRNPKLLWLLCPLVLYWITRIWFLAQRGQMHSDPIVFALNDWRSVVVALVGAAIVVTATFFY
jgi:4-hydroxybenzoate polyprenyltransferase/phosphoserine phosphatase